MCLEKRFYHGVIYLVLTFIELRSLGEFCVLMELLGCKFTYYYCIYKFSSYSFSPFSVGRHSLL